MVLHPEDEYQLRALADRLSAEDPSLAAYLAGTTRRRRPRIVLAVVYLLGAALLGLGFSIDQPLLVLAGLATAPFVPIVGVWLLRPQSRQTAPEDYRTHPVFESEE